MPANTRETIRVLVVDDEQPVLDAYRQILSDATQSAAQAGIEDLRAKLFPASATSTGSQALPSAKTFDAVFCTDAESAVATVREACANRRPFSVVFLDMRMPPGPNGAWAAEQIRAIDPGIEIVICTAYSDVDPAEIARRVPPEDKLLYLQKPFHPYEVRQMAIALGEKRWSSERRIAQLTHFDALTGLPNRARFIEHLARTVEDARHRESKLAVLYIDLDNFKRINETLGHAVGDEFLCLVADRIRETLRGDDMTARAVEHRGSSEDSARLGSDEFVVLLPDIHEAEDGARVAQRLLSTISQATRLALHDLTVTASIGIAVHQGDDLEADLLFRQSGLAMYAAKRAGGARYVMFDGAVNAGALMRLSLEGHLRSALGKNELCLHYQPKFDLATGLISGLEALLRWTNPELGTVAPMEFIPVAEESGLMLPIGEWVLRTACSQVNAWNEAGLPAGQIAVNVSGVQLAQSSFPAVVARILKETGLPPAMLDLEITESLMMKDEGHSKQALAALKALGVSLTIDDFGTGHSSLSRIREWPVDRLKIDRAFVRNIETLEKDRAIVSTIISLAKTLRLQVVAEGVEDFAQLLFLQDEKCDQAQGFLLSRPLPTDAAELFLNRLAVSTASSRTQRLRMLSP